MALKSGKSNVSINRNVQNILTLLDTKLINFVNSQVFINRNYAGITEDEVTSALRFFLETESDLLEFGLSFETQAVNPNKRTVDLGISLKAGLVQSANEIGNYIFFIEAKWLDAPDYVTTNTGAIKRFKSLNHGIQNPNPSRPQVAISPNAIVGYRRKKMTFQQSMININQDIKTLISNHSVTPDNFGLIWGIGETLCQKISTEYDKYISTHLRIDNSNVILHHFWVKVS